MPQGPGKYDDICTDARMKANAVGAVLLIIEGDHGHGFSIQAPVIVLQELPRFLRQIADDVEKAHPMPSIDKP